MELSMFTMKIISILPKLKLKVFGSFCMKQVRVSSKLIRLIRRERKQPSILVFFGSDIICSAPRTPKLSWNNYSQLKAEKTLGLA